MQLAASLVEQLRALDNIIRLSSHTASTLHGLVLQHGVGRFGARLPKGMRRRTPRHCFKNAATLVTGDSDRFVYCEGYALRASLDAVLGTHAWALDRTDWRTIDLTWDNPVEGIYMGIPFSYDFLWETIARRRVYGIIDNYEEDYPICTADPARFLHPLAAEIPRDFPP